MDRNNNHTYNVLKDKKTIVTCIIAIVIVLILIFLLSQCNKDKTDENVDSTEIIKTNTQEPTEDPSYYELKQDAIPALNDLIATYFTAMENCDVEQYTNVVTGDDMTAEKLEKKGEYIESYQNITCYTKPGMTDGTYIVYVYYEVKFYNIDTLAPALSQLYVCSNEDGTMYIYAGSLDGELSAYINTMNSAEDVLTLNGETEEKLQAALDSNEKLLLLVQKLREGADYEEPEMESEVEESVPIDQMEFEDRDEAVLTTTAVRVRSTPTTESEDNIVGLLEAGESATRTGYNSQWSRIEYNGEVAYVATQYLITK